MNDREFNPDRLDVAAWARDGRPLQGELALARCQRLAESLSEPASGQAAWAATVTASSGPVSKPIVMDLQIEATVPLVCQRCLQPLQQPLRVERRFLFAPDEAEAQRLDDETEDDVLVLERRFDLTGLLEDELILALPLVPRHEPCPQPLPLVAEAELDEAPVAEHPFAALAALKRSTGSRGGTG